MHKLLWKVRKLLWKVHKLLWKIHKLNAYAAVEGVNFAMEGAEANVCFPWTVYLLINWSPIMTLS